MIPMESVLFLEQEYSHDVWKNTDMDQPATRQDVLELKTDLRGDLKEHERDDKAEFKAIRDELKGEISSVRSEVKILQKTIDNWSGGLALMKFFAVMGGASCIAGAGTLIVHVIRHW